MKRSFIHELLLGILAAMLILPSQPVQAQWTTYDAAAYAQRARSELKRAQEWIQKVQQYQQMYTTAVNQYTTMRGVLQTVDRQLAKNLQLARLTNDVSDIIRGSYQLKNRVENMTRYQIAALQQIDDRLRNGIFDLEADRQAFEDYLQHSLGRNSRQTVKLAAQAANADAQLSKWNTEKERLAGEKAAARNELMKLRARLAAEKNNPDPSNLQPLNAAIQQLETYTSSLEKTIAELDEKIQQRMNAYGLRLSDMENFGYTILSTNEAWRELQTTKDEIAETFDGLILGMTP